MPYAILAGALPPSKMGYYMGVFNFFIVIPQIVAAALLGFIVGRFFGGQAIDALLIGGVSLVLAAMLTLKVKDDDVRPALSTLSDEHHRETHRRRPRIGDESDDGEGCGAPIAGPIDHHAQSGRTRLRDAVSRSRGGVSSDRRGEDPLHRRRRHPGVARIDRREARARQWASLHAGSGHRWLRGQAGDFQRVARQPRSRRRSHHPDTMLGVLSGDGAARGRFAGSGVDGARGIPPVARGARARVDAAHEVAAPQLPRQSDRRRLLGRGARWRSPACWSAGPTSGF